MDYVELTAAIFDDSITLDDLKAKYMADKKREDESKRIKGLNVSDNSTTKAAIEYKNRDELTDDYLVAYNADEDDELNAFKDMLKMDYSHDPDEDGFETQGEDANWNPDTLKDALAELTDLQEMASQQNVSLGSLQEELMRLRMKQRSRIAEQQIAQLNNQQQPASASDSRALIVSSDKVTSSLQDLEDEVEGEINRMIEEAEENINSEEEEDYLSEEEKNEGRGMEAQNEIDSSEHALVEFGKPPSVRQRKKRVVDDNESDFEEDDEKMSKWRQSEAERIIQDRMELASKIYEKYLNDDDDDDDDDGKSDNGDESSDSDDGYEGNREDRTVEHSTRSTKENQIATSSRLHSSMRKSLTKQSSKSPLPPLQTSQNIQPLENTDSKRSKNSRGLSQIHAAIAAPISPQDYTEPTRMYRTKLNPISQTLKRSGGSESRQIISPNANPNSRSHQISASNAVSSTKSKREGIPRRATSNEPRLVRPVHSEVFKPSKSSLSEDQESSSSLRQRQSKEQQSQSTEKPASLLNSRPVTQRLSLKKKPANDQDDNEEPVQAVQDRPKLSPPAHNVDETKGESNTSSSFSFKSFVDLKSKNLRLGVSKAIARPLPQSARGPQLTDSSPSK